MDRFGGLRHRPTDLGGFFCLFFLILGYFFYITSYNGIVFFIQKYSLYIIVFKNLYIHNDTLCYNIEYAFCLIEDSHIHCSQDPNGHILTVLFFSFYKDINISPKLVRKKNDGFKMIKIHKLHMF